MKESGPSYISAESRREGSDSVIERECRAAVIDCAGGEAPVLWLVDDGAPDTRAVFFGAEYDGPKREHHQASQASDILNCNGRAIVHHRANSRKLNDFAVYLSLSFKSDYSV